jgi:hypothetical protein
MPLRLAAVLVVLSGLAAQAQQAPLPKEVQAAIDDSRKDCGEPVRLDAKFVTSKDVNGDGKPDYILDYEHFQCGETITYFCGSGGCLTQVFASLPDGSYVKAWDANVRAIRFARVKGKPAMILDLHGSACGKVGAAPCPRTLIWNGKTFAGRT